MSQPRLPIDILLLIVESLPSTKPPMIHSPSDVVTRTLIAFTTVCRATRSTASRLLWRHCMYIDSSKRARNLVRYLSSLWPPTIHERGPIRLFLSPFDAPIEESANEKDIHKDDWSINETSRDLQSYFNSPASSGSSNWPPSPLDDLPTALLVQDIFKMLAPVLTSLIIDMPLRSLYPESDHNGVRKVLRHGFELLVNLEEFVSVRDELFLDTEVDVEGRGTEVWSTYWPKLRRLALYNVDLSPDLYLVNAWGDMAQLQHLELAVFTRADPGRLLADTDIKRIWFNLVAPSMQRRITLAFADSADGLASFGDYRADWNILDPDNHMRIVTIAIRQEPDEDGQELLGENSGEIEYCQEWIKQQSLRGTLWHEAWHGLDVCQQHT